MNSRIKNRNIIILLFLLLLIGISVYLLYNTRGNLEFALSLRGRRIPAFIIVGCTTTIATIIFQTITNNNILTPNVIGLNSMYIMFQTVTIFFLGSSHFLVMNDQLNFIVSTSLMVIGSMGLYYLFFKKFPGRLYLLLMTGFILGTFMNSFTTFMQAIIDPNEFENVLSRTMASFNEVETSLIALSLLISIPILIYIFSQSNVLDVFHLGEDYATSLGISVNRKYLILFILISILTAISTALVGPVTFLGFLGANLSYRIFRTYKHSVLFIGGSLFTTVMIIFGQTIVEHVFNFQTTIGVVLEFIGGMYFLYILVKERNRLG